MRIRGIFLAIIATSLLFAAGPSHAQSSDQLADVKTLVRYFDIVAFGNEFTGQRFARVRKWVDPIRIGLQGKYPEYFELFVLQQILDLQQLTNHRIELYYSPILARKKLLPRDFDQKKTNVILFYLPRDKISGAVTKYFDNDPAQVAAIVKSSTCFAKIFKRGDEIRNAIAVFPAEHSKDFMRACVVEELTQILGLPNDSAIVEASIFNDHSQYFELTKNDRMLVQVLYDPRITFAMPRQQALRLARTITLERGALE